jgi:hypothetical protein
MSKKPKPPLDEQTAPVTEQVLNEAFSFNRAAKKFAAELNRGKVGAPGILSSLDRDAYLKSIAPKN